MSTALLDACVQRWPLPARPRPIVLIGAGSIANDGHLPAYREAGLPVVAMFDTDRSRLEACTRTWGIPLAARTLEEALNVPGAVFDIATPPAAFIPILEQVPPGSAVLLQKPMGSDLAMATAIRDICHRRRLTAAVNFQLRFAPNMLALRDVIRRGELGVVDEIEVLINVRTPWHLWPFLRNLARMEMLVHSIHYLDLVRSLVGEPTEVMARTVGHRDQPLLADSRTSAILDFGPDVRCCFSVHHHHRYGPRFERSELRVEGADGAAVAVMGVNLDYPRGRPDALLLATEGRDWIDVPLAGNWFPDAFRGPMSNLQRVCNGEDEALVSPVEDAWKTMRLVEACYAADARGGIRPDDLS